MRQVRSLGLSSRFPRCAAFALTLIIFGTGLCDPVQARIIEFDPPGSGYTYPIGINASKWIVGQYYDSAPYAHSFLRAPDGTFTTIDVQSATRGTYANSINRSGVIVGEEADGPDLIRAEADEGYPRRYRPVGSLLKAASLSTRMSEGRPSTRSAMMLRRISSVPPAMRYPGAPNQPC